jgi:hypothetical protein
MERIIWRRVGDCRVTSAADQEAVLLEVTDLLRGEAEAAGPRDIVRRRVHALGQEPVWKCEQSSAGSRARRGRWRMYQPV